MRGLIQDLRYAIRQLEKSPGFTATVLLILALGIGANTAIFSLINGLMLRTLPVRQPGQLVELLHRSPGEPPFNGFSWDAYQLLRTHNHVLTDLIVDSSHFFVVRGQKLEPQTVSSGFVSGNFFETLGVRPAGGRFPSIEGDDLNHPSPVAVISWLCWKARFNADPAILGKQIFVNDAPVTIIGVAQEGFNGLSEDMRQELWLPLSMKPVIYHTPLQWGDLGLDLIGRLKPSVSIAQARAELAVLFQTAIQAPNVGPYVRQMTFEIAPAASGLSTPIRQMLEKPAVVLMVIVGLVLLIACANLAGLMLARAASRRHEMAVRACLGAGRLRLMRQALTESLLLSLLGSVLGMFLADFGSRGLLRMITNGRDIVGLPVHPDALVRPDSHVLLFTGVVALLTALLFGVVPALSSSALPASALQRTTRIGESRSRRLLGKGLIVSQVAVSMVLLSTAALFVSYVSRLRNLDLGFRRDHLLLVNLDTDNSGYDAPRWSSLSQQLLAQLETIPGVRSATLSGMTPMLGAGASSFATIQGCPENHREISINFVAPKYFGTYGTPLLAGRDFAFNDDRGPLVAIINQTMARDYFGAGNPIGSYVTLDHVTLRGNDTPTYEIVGVVGDAKYNELQQTSPRTLYLNAFQEDRIVSQLTVRTTIAPEAVAKEVRRKVESVLKTVSIGRVTTMTDQIDASIVPERLTATLSVWFGVLGALLAAVGLYGLLAYTVSRRTNEIGIRMVLGASGGKVMWMVLAEALGMVGVGVLLGAPLAFWSKRIAARLIEGLPLQDSTPVIVGIAVITGTVLLAAYLPARRATRVDPNVALRYE